MLLTIGHSTRSLEEFVSLLREHGVLLLVDVRRFPGSRRMPWFGREQLERTLQEVGIAYQHAEALGGRRKPGADSPNQGLRNEQFRGYADYMLTPEFREALDQLLTRARETTVCVMCAEAVPWRCHRSLLADAALARGVQAEHITGGGKRRPHTLHPAALLSGQTVTYPLG